MANNAPLIGHGDRYFGGFIQDNALAAQAAFEAWVERPVNEILFLVGYFLDVFFPLLYVHVAGGAGADAATVVVEVNVVFFGDFEDGHILKTARHGLDRDIFIFKLELNGSHVW